MADASSQQQRASRPFFIQRVPLNSLHAQQVYERGFDVAANAIFSLSIILRVIGTNEQALEFEKGVDDRIKKHMDDLAGESARLHKLADANGIEFQGISYSNPRVMDAQITSPRAAHYAGLIREFDALAARFDTLWLSGVIPDSDYSRSIYEWKRRLLKVANSIRATANQAMVAARKKQQGATAVSEKDNQDLDEAAKVLNETPDAVEGDAEDTVAAAAVA